MSGWVGSEKKNRANSSHEKSSEVAHEYSKDYFLVGGSVIASSTGAWIANRQFGGVGVSYLRTGTAPGMRVPSILFSTINGEELATNELRGKVAVFNAFASCCGPCRVETPELVKFYQDNQDKVILIGLNVGEGKAAVLGYQQDFGVPYPLVLDPGGKIAEQFRARGLPTTRFIDTRGIVQTLHLGLLTTEQTAQNDSGD